MAYNAKGFKTLTHIGTADGAVGTNRVQHGYVTVDDNAAVTTSGYFNTIRDRLKIGDQIFASLEIGGSAKIGLFVVTALTPNVTIGEYAGLGIIGGQDAVTLGGAALTDSSGGTPATTLAAITNAANAGSADVAPVANAIASLAAQVDAQRTAIAALIARLEAAGVIVD